MTRDRALRDPVTGKVFATSCDGAVVTIRSGTPGKERVTAKRQASAAGAVKFAAKQEIDHLRQGFVLANPDAPAGEPRLHKSVTRNYTGALALADAEGTLVCNAFDPKRDIDAVRFVGRDGSDLSRIELWPETLIWKIEYIHDLRRILLLADHGIVSWSISDRDLTIYRKPNKDPVSFLSTAGTRAAWYEQPDVVVADLQSHKQLLRLHVEPGDVGGSLVVKGALSPNGDLLALINGRNEISVLEISSGTVIAKCSYDFYLIDALQFSIDGRFLFVRSLQYGRLLCFDLSTNGLPRYALPFGDRFTRAVALDPAGRRLAVAFFETLAVYDFRSSERIIEFPLEFCVERLCLAWSGQDLGAITDLGCLSLYALG